MAETNTTAPKRGRPPKTKVAENKTNAEVNAYAYDTSLPFACSIFGDYLDSAPYSLNEIQAYVNNPQFYNKRLRDLGWWAYNKNGSVRAAVNYICSMHTLDKVIVCKNRRVDKSRPKNFEKNRIKMLSVLDKINYKKQIRDNLMKDANDGIAFYYFETQERPQSNTKFLSDYAVSRIVEINESGFSVSIIPLPVDWCRIIGTMNGSYRVAFNLHYFDQFGETERASRLRNMPKEIRDNYDKYLSNSVNSWLALDINHTITTKVNSATNQPWGCPLALTALDDIMYADSFIKTKRNVLDNLNNNIIYMTFPEGKEKGTSSLTRDQQKDQHEKVKQAVTTRSNAKGTVSFFSLASGTKLDQMKVDIGIFDEKNESTIKDAVPADLGISSASLDGNTKGNYATASINLELVAGYVYTWIEQYISELNKCVNATIIKDPSCTVDVYILPITYVNRDKQVSYMKELYAQGKGSLMAWVSACGFDADAYISLMDYELEAKFEEKYPVHRTSYTQSSDDNKGGRPTVDSPTNENTIQSQSSGANLSPSPSD